MKEWIKKNIWNLLGFLFGVAGLLSAYITYVAAEKTPNFTVINNDAHSKIVGTELSQRGSLKLIRKDGTEVTKSVFVTSVTLWNSGDLAFREAAIIKKLSIDLPAEAEILDISPIKIIREDITGFEFTPTHTGFEYKWRILEPNDGAIFQIMYAANAPVKINTNGAIEGVLSLVDGNTSSLSGFKAFLVATKGILAFLGIVGGGIFVFIAAGRFLNRLKHPFPRLHDFITEKIPSAFVVLVTFGLVWLFVMACYSHYKNTYKEVAKEIPAQLK